jgi:ABC-type dipeptide/oligopeptide/nickel transport system permease component
VLRYAIRRLLWALPTLLGVSLVVFFITTLMPDPLAAVGRVDQLTPEAFDRLQEERRARFLDLPRFLNTEPSDVARLTRRYVDTLGRGDADADVAARRLGALGGAALPHVLPTLGSMPPASRRRVALALAPVGKRMGRFEQVAFDDPESATTFWERFWDDHSIDFTEPSARRAVERLVQHGGRERERDLYLLDTYATPYLMAALVRVDRRDAQTQLVRVLAHVTERGDSMLIPDDAPAPIVRARIADWRAFWVVHASDYTVLSGGERVAATFTQTRYGKWTVGAISGDLVSAGEQRLSLGDRLTERALLTLSLTFLAMLISFGISVPLGAALAYRRRRVVDRVVAISLFAAYALPAFVLGELLLRISGDRHRALWAVLTLTVSAVATLSRYQRAAVIEVLASDYIRAARSKGVYGARLMVVHALRNALGPMVSLAGIQFPVLLGSAFVVEEVFQLRGMGWETLRAIERHDAAWMVVAVMATALVAMLSLLASDIGLGLLDPRVRDTLRRRAT